MAIKKFYVDQKKEGLPYDKQKNKYFSWGYDIYLDGRRVQERGFLTRELAEKAAAKKKTESKMLRHGISAPAKPIYLSNLLQKKLDTLAGAERVRAKRVFQDFLSLLPARFRVTELKTAHIQRYIEKRLSEKDGRTGRPISPLTVKRELVPIVSALNSAYLFYEELEDYRPPRFPQIKTPKDRKERVLTAREHELLLNYFFAPQRAGESTQSYLFRRRVGHFFQTLLLTVSRPGEIAALKPSDVDFTRGFLTVRGTKTRFKQTRTVRVLRLTPTLREILTERIEHARRREWAFVFTHHGRIAWRFYDQLKKACEACGISYGKDAADGVTFHTARHTGTTTLARSNEVDTKTIGAFTGHSDQTMTLYYTHTNLNLVNQVGEILEKNFGSPLASGEFLESKYPEN